MAETLLKVREVSKNFGGLCAVNRVSIDISRDSIVGMVGPNGCGKTTLLSTIFGLQKADAGSILFNNEPIDKLSPHQIYAKGMANAFQIPRLFFQLSVLDNMILAARDNRGDKLLNSVLLRKGWQNQEVEIVDRVMEVLELLELDHLTFSPAGELSGGQKKLLEIGRAIIAEPKLLLLDEPVAGINPVLGKKIFEKLEHLRQGGMSFLIIEHRLELLMEFANWVYVMDRGRMVLEGQPKEIVNSPKFYEVYIGGVDK